MADQQLPDPDAAGAISDLGQAIVDAVLNPKNQEKVKRFIQDVQLETTKDHGELGTKSSDDWVAWFFKKFFDIINAGDPLFEKIGKIAVDSLLEKRQHGGVPDDIGSHIVERLTGGAHELQPDVTNAHRFISLFAKLQVETWALGVFTEVLSEFVPHGFSLSAEGVETVAQLREVVANVFGGTRVMRRVLGPFITAAIVTPATWATNKQYRPQLLSPAEAIRQWNRGRWTLDQRDEEIGRQGYSNDRIDALVNGARKFLSEGDVEFLVTVGAWSDEIALQYLKDQGVSDVDAQRKLLMIPVRVAQTEARQIAELAISAYAKGDLGDVELDGALKDDHLSVEEKRRYRDRAFTKRRYNVTRITSAHMRALVLDGIASVHDYIETLTYEGYPPREQLLLELSLRKEQQTDHDLEKAKAEKKRADEQRAAAAAADKAAKQAALEEARSRTFPALAEFRRAYVRGFVDRQVYVDALVREKIADDDASFLLAGADADRDQLLADEAAAEQKKADHVDKGLSVATLEQAVLQGILTIGEFDAALAKAKIPDADRHLLVQLLRAKLDDQAAAEAKRADADRLAVLKGSSIAEWEHAVRLGVRSLDEYARFLVSLEISEPARALILDVLAAQLDVDAEAKATRAARADAAAAKGISLAQRRRAVIAGVRPRAFYEQALLEAGWSVDDQLAELDLVDVEIAAAAAARAKRDQVAAKVDQSTLTLAQLEQAFTLGLLTPAEFTAALRARGATAADADLLVRLAVTKVPDARAAQSLHAKVAEQLAAKSISLADMEHAVRAGLRTPEQYAAELASRGYGEDDVALLRQLLEDTIALDQAKLEERAAALLAKADGAPALKDLVAQFHAGALGAGDVQASLVAAGVPADVAVIVARLLASSGTAP